MSIEQQGADLFRRYNEMKKQGKIPYFDVEEFDEVAFLYETKGNYNEALAVIQNGLKQHPGNVDLLIKEARYLLYVEQIDEAEKKLSVLPYEDEEVIVLKAELCLYKRENEQAIEWLNSLLDHENFSPDLCLDVLDLLVDFNRMSELTDFAEKALQRISDTTDILRELASIYEEKEQFDLALKTYDRLLEQDPYSSTDWLGLAKIYAIKKNYEKAIEACDYALAIDENDLNALSFRGYCLFDTRRYEEAIAVFDEYVRNGGSKSIAYELIAECYSALKKTKEAIVYLTKAYEINPRDVETCYQLAVNYFDTGEMQSAIDFLKKAITIDDKDSSLYSFLGEIYLRQREFALAENYLGKAVFLVPNNEEAYMLLGDLKAIQEMPEEAIPYYNQVLNITPYDIKVTFKLILAQYNAGNLEEAASLIKHLDQIMNENGTAEIPDNNKSDILQARNMLDTLRNILRDNLDEKI